MTPFSDVRVHDLVVFDEIELYGELIIAASQSEGPLTKAEIDAVLGIGTKHQPTHTVPWKLPPGERPHGGGAHGGRTHG